MATKPDSPMSPVMEHGMSHQGHYHNPEEDSDNEEWAWEQQMMYHQSRNSTVQVLNSPGHPHAQQQQPRSRSRTSSADEIIPFYDPNMTYQQEQQAILWLQQNQPGHHLAHQQANSPLPPHAVDYDNYGGTPNSSHSTKITWSEPGHPLLSPSRDDTGYGATKTPTPPSSRTKQKRRHSSGGSGKKSSRPPSSILRTPTRTASDDQHQLTQIYSSGQTKSPQGGYGRSNSPPPPPPPRSALSRGHRRIHSATDGETAPLLPEDPAPRSGNSPLPKPSHSRTGSFGSERHRRTSSWGGRPTGHRRTNSFGSDSRGAHHQRNLSSEGLPPVSPGYAMDRRKSSSGGSVGALPPRATRARSFSSGDGGGRSLLPNSPGPTYALRRSGSELSFTSGISGISGGASVASVGSVVSDVRRSKLFRGITETGKILFHAPTDKVSLLMDTEMEAGILYKSSNPDDYDAFDEYLMEEEINYLEGCACNCSCDNCAVCYKKNQSLSEAKYILTVKDDLYKRVLSEVSDSRSMPCKLFYCGHHEDVDHPSIYIAVVIVVSIFVMMAAVSWWYGPSG